MMLIGNGLLTVSSEKTDWGGKPQTRNHGATALHTIRAVIRLHLVVTLHTVVA